MKQSYDDDFRTWVAAKREQLRRTAYLLCGDWHLADDLVQEALTRAYPVWRKVRSRGEPDGYVRKIVVNLFLDHRRRPARREHPTDVLPDAAVMDHEVGDRDRVLAALALVAPGQRAALVLRYWEDLSIEQTARVLGRSAGNVKSQTARGLESFRAALAEVDAETTQETR